MTISRFAAFRDRVCFSACKAETRKSFGFVLIALSMISNFAPPAGAETLADRLKGYSIDAQSTMRVEGSDKGRIFRELNTRFMQIYVSSAGRIFDYSKIETGGERSGDMTVHQSGLKIVRFGEKWLMGNVWQRWDIVAGGLIRTRIYPWGSQIYTMTITPDLTSCAVGEEMKSSLPDKAFFLFQWQGHRISKVLSHETVSASCKILHGNIFDKAAQDQQ